MVGFRWDLSESIWILRILSGVLMRDLRELKRRRSTKLFMLFSEGFHFIFVMEKSFRRSTNFV